MPSVAVSKDAAGDHMEKVGLSLYGGARIACQTRGYQKSRPPWAGSCRTTARPWQCLQKRALLELGGKPKRGVAAAVHQRCNSYIQLTKCTTRDRTCQNVRFDIPHERD